MASDSNTPALITVTINQFHKIGGDHTFSDADVQLTDGGNIATQGKVNDPINVIQSGTLVFTLQAKEGDDDTYVPVGIGFKEGASTDPIGSSAFPTRTIGAGDDGVIVLTLVDANKEENSFEFGLVIERASDGSLSVIDPRITNDP